jgi:hypothetical protein
MNFQQLARILVAAASLTAGRAFAQDSRLINLASRADVGTGANILFCGFTIAPGANKTVLVRAVGPTLTSFGVSGALADPRLELFSGTTLLNSNDNWSAADGATFSSVGAFALPAGSKDSALVVTLAPGGYTAQVSGVGNATGVALVEIYEVGATGPRLTNLSTRAVVGTGGNVLIPGIVINPGTGARRLLVRAVGPTLAGFGVSGTLADPTLVVKNAAGTTIASNDNWGTPVGTGASAASLASFSSQAGAFALPADSKDSAVLMDFDPGSYTIQVSGVNATTASVWLSSTT